MIFIRHAVRRSPARFGVPFSVWRLRTSSLLQLCIRPHAVELAGESIVGLQMTIDALLRPQHSQVEVAVGQATDILGRSSATDGDLECALRSATCTHG